MITDIAAIYRFFKLGQKRFAWANIAFVGGGLFLQLLLVCLQNIKRGWKVVAYEMMICLLMIKPAVDASRVANGEAQDENALFENHFELMITKIIEMFTESIPSSVLQTYAILSDTDTLSKQAVLSIFISAGCISFTSSTLSMDLDTDPKRRSISPSFYGYFPDKNRIVVFVLMCSMTTAHVLMKVLACSLMLRLSAMWFWLYSCGDMFLYFLYKLVRGDLRYWINLGGLLGWSTTIFSRVIGKIVVDFTLMVHFRHSFELGGASWSFTVFSNQAFCFISVLLYSEYSNASEDVEVLLWQLVGSLFFFSMLNFALFLLSINKEYRGTFFSNKTGAEFLCQQWRDASTDKEKVYIFGKHRSYYSSINKEIKVWLDENWGKWEEERPDWFTAKLISKIPSELLPKEAVLKYGGLIGKSKSIVALIKAEEKEDEEKKVEKAKASATQIVPLGPVV